MSFKAFHLTVELNIHAITCPGVWLCPNSGRISLCIFMLDSCGQTTLTDPIFPLLVHERFVFNKIIHGARNLQHLEEVLCKETLYCELVQWSIQSSDEGNVLASFQTCLSNLLYPKVVDKRMLAGVDIELLMEACKCFPGIIAPKIEVSTKTTIKEVRNMKHKCTCPNYIVNPKTISSSRYCRRAPHKRQKKVCHTNPFKKTMQCSRKLRLCQKPLISTTCSWLRRISSDVHNRIDCTPKWVSHKFNNCKKYEKLQPTVCECIKNVRKSPPVKHKEQLAKKCLCHSQQVCNQQQCSVCTKYQEYFNELTCSLSDKKKTNLESCVSKCSDSSYIKSADLLHKRISNILNKSINQDTFTNNSLKPGTNCSAIDTNESNRQNINQQCVCPKQKIEKDLNVAELNNQQPPPIRQYKLDCKCHKYETSFGGELDTTEYKNLPLKYSSNINKKIPPERFSSTKDTHISNNCHQRNSCQQTKSENICSNKNVSIEVSNRRTCKPCCRCRKCVQNNITTSVHLPIYCHRKK